MAENDEKAQKLKEIQDRLAEIQNKTSLPKASQENKKEDKTAPKPKSSETPPKKESITARVKEVPKTQEIPQPVVKKKETIKEVVKTNPIEKTKENLSQEELNWKENRVKAAETANTAEALKQTSKDKKPETKKKKKTSLTLVYTIISVIVTLSVASYFVYTFFISTDSVTEIESTIPVPIEDETSDVTDEEIGEESLENAEDLSTEEVVSQQEEVLEEVQVSEKEKVEVEKPKQAPPVKKRNIEPEANGSVSSIIPKGIIISYASNSTEKAAQDNAVMLKRKGFKSSYYYMPDMNPNGPALYKVYVGPYSDESAAMSDFKKVVDINPSAFILRLN